jgi:ubiquitin-conjugating enzyme E2 J1
MEAPKGFNMNNPGVRRLLRELRDLEREPSDQYEAHPLEDNIFEWHFTIRGPKGTDFEGGAYHGRIILPPEYPFKPPDFVFLSSSGRFEVGSKICLTVSAHHPESWQPSWSIRTALLAIISFLPAKAEGAIGAIDYSSSERKSLAKKCHSYKCEKCGRSIAQTFERWLQLEQEQREKEALKLSSSTGAPLNTSNSDLGCTPPGRDSLLMSAPPPNVTLADISFTIKPDQATPSTPSAPGAPGAAATPVPASAPFSPRSAAAATPSTPSLRPLLLPPGAPSAAAPVIPLAPPATPASLPPPVPAAVQPAAPAAADQLQVAAGAFLKAAEAPDSAAVDMLIRLVMVMIALILAKKMVL